MTKHSYRFGEVVNDFSNAPFRLFFLSACLSAILGAGCGFGNDDLNNLRAFFFWQSFIGAAYAGFLFTAIPKWTKDQTPLAKPLQKLWLVWFIGTISSTFSLSTGLMLMIGFWTMLLLLTASLIYKHRDGRQLSFLFSIAAIGLMTIWLTIKLRRADISDHDWQQLLHLGLLAFMLVTFRMSRAIGSQALKDSKLANSQFIPNPYYKNLQLGLFYLLLITNLLLQNAVIEGWLSLSIAAVTLGRLREWHFSTLLKHHYVRWLYLSLFFIGIAYGWRGLALIHFGDFTLLKPELATTLLEVSGFMLLIYQVFNFAALRNSNCAVVYPLICRIALSALLIAGISASLGAGLMPEYRLYLGVYLPNMLIAGAFLVYIPTFYQIFIGRLNRK